MSEPSIFTRIVRGEIPCTKVFENDKVLAFLDINPVNKGHTLIIPKEQYADIFELPAELMSEVALATQKVAKAIKTVTGAPGVNIIQNNGKSAGQEVFHYHVHIIPRQPNDGVKFVLASLKYGEGEANELAEKIRNSL